jgi:ABC-type multidrug transport system fused ATPase/permease subunit
VKPGRASLVTLREVIGRLPKRYLLYLGLLCMIANAVADVFAGHLLRLLVDAATQGAGEVFKTVLSATVALHLVRSLVSWGSAYSTGKYAETGVSHLREEAVQHLTKASFAEMEKIRSGDIISRLTTDLLWVRMFLGTNLSVLIYSPLEIVLVFAYLCSVNWKLTLVAMAAAPVLVVIGRIFSPAMYRLGLELRERAGALTATIRDVLAGISVCRAFNLEEVFDAKHGAVVDEVVAKARKLASKHVMLGAAEYVMDIVPYIVLLGAGAYWVARGEMSPGSLVAFVTLSGRLTLPLSRLPGLLGRMQVDMTAAGRILSIFDMMPERSGGKSILSHEEDPKPVIVRAENLSFSYPGRDSAILEGVSFEVKQGEKVAVVGPSGSGKSTLAKLLVGLYEGYTGSLKVMGVEVKERDLKALRNRLAFMAQDTFLFPGSIGDNIRLGNPKAKADDVVRAAMEAQVHGFAQELPRGYDTEVGELGGRISGGEKQRVSLARAILRKPSLFIMDEPTSALDAGSEAAVEEALRSSLRGRTSLVISHRLSSVKDADRILVLDEGEVVECGTHEELLDRGGLYARLYRVQVGAVDG